MEIKIFNVTHGFCAYLVADNGNVMLFDCGHNEITGFRPSDYLPQSGCRSIQYLIIHNFDQDHVSDLPNLINVLPVQIFFRNRSLPSETLEALKLKNGPITVAMKAAIKLHTDYIHDYLPPVFPNIEIKFFHNKYPTFTDTNNLSLVAFIHYDGIGFIFPGDLEKAGWQELLKIEEFCNHLRRVNIFVASHHGRENGYCEDVFNYCKNPDIIIVSDKEIIHETQKNIYAKHAIGVPWEGMPEKRYVLTTRSDGMVTFNKQLGARYLITI